MWCTNNDHIQKDYGVFAEALRKNLVYLWNNRVHVSETRRPLERKTGRGGMKRITEEAAVGHVKVVHYSVSARIRVGGEKRADSGSEDRFCLILLEGFYVKKLRREEASRAEWWIR